MTDEECRQEDERIALQEQKVRKEREKQLLEQGVSIFDILQPAQGDAFEPTVQFTSE